MFFSKAILVVVVSVVAVSVIATPHALNHALHHRAIAARVVPPPPHNLTVTPPIRKRQNAQRCRKRPVPSSSSLPNPSPSSSTHAQPPHTTTQQQAPPVETPKPSPSPTTVHQQPTPTTTTAPPSSGNNGNQPSFLIGTQSGQGTFYSTGLGACGITNNDNDFIAAVSHLMFDDFPDYNHINPNTNPICKKKIRATYQGKSVTVTITDRCEACAVTDLDFSPAAFNEIALPAAGRISGMTWVWL